MNGGNWVEVDPHARWLRAQILILFGSVSEPGEGGSYEAV